LPFKIFMKSNGGTARNLEQTRKKREETAGPEGELEKKLTKETRISALEKWGGGKGRLLVREGGT